jgi:hypothetical protein
MTVEKCDENGNISGTASVTTVEGQGHDNEWIRYTFEGKIDFDDYTFHMQGVNEISSNSDSNWSFAVFDGTLAFDSTKNNDVISGMVEKTEGRDFYFARVSGWAKDEVTEANLYSVIPETLKKKDLSKPVTRAEFAAISVNLYELLTNKTAERVKTPFKDISGNNDIEAIEKAYGLNIAIGVSADKFEPDTYINREQLATMLCRTIKKYKYEDWSVAKDDKYVLDYSGVNKFKDDSSISAFAKPSVYYMAKMQVILGYADGNFAPKNFTDEQKANNYATATREQAVVMAYRIYKLSEEL